MGSVISFEYSILTIICDLHYLQNITRSDKPTTIKLVTILHILFYCMYFTTLLSFRPLIDQPIIQVIFIGIDKIWIVCSGCSLYVLLLIRLQTTFGVTPYFLSKSVFYHYSLYIASLFVIWTLYAFFAFQSTQLKTCFCFGLLTLNITIGSLMMYSFNSRLPNIITPQSCSIAIGDDLSHSEYQYEIEWNPRSKSSNKWIETIIKTSILSSIAIVCLQILILLWALYEQDTVKAYSNQ
eukprot:641460_1